MSKDYVWGGQKLLSFGKYGKASTPLAEVWEIADRPEDSMISTIANGALKGKTLAYLMEHHQQELLGNHHANAKHFPLLIKIIDAKETLSVQVHPNSYTAKILGGKPKTEAWLILDGSHDGAKIWAGLKNNLTNQSFANAIKNNSLIQKIQTYPVTPDEIYSIPSGTIHAIGAGCLILEVQENSNTTYRLHDWGRGRELHIREAIIATNLKKSKQIKRKNGQLKNKIFSLKIQNKTGALATNGNFQIIFNLSEQNLRITYKSHRLTLKQFETCLIPASCQKFSVNGARAKYALITT